MKAFTDQQALDLGRAILNRFEEGLNGKKWEGLTVTLPIKLYIQPEKNGIYYMNSQWSSSIVLSVPYFFKLEGLHPNEKMVHVTLDEWLDENAHG